MKWIKASERLPADPYELVCMRGDGGGCYHHETADRSMLIQRLKDDEDAHHKYDPEWLDESQPETIEPDKGKWSDLVNWLKAMKAAQKERAGMVGLGRCHRQAHEAVAVAFEQVIGYVEEMVKPTTSPENQEEPEQFEALRQVYRDVLAEPSRKANQEQD